jgi:hypothetical protein
MTNPTMRNYYVDRLIAQLAARPAFILSRPPPF